MKQKPIEPKISAPDLAIDTNKSQDQHKELSKIIESIVRPSDEYQYLSYEPKKQKKKKRKSQHM